MASEQVLDVAVRRHIFYSERPFPAVLDGIFDGVSQPASLLCKGGGGGGKAPGGGVGRITHWTTPMRR